MQRDEAEADQSLLVSSAPLGWPHLVVERRFFRRNRLIDKPQGYPEHRILIWDQPVSCTLTVAGRPLVLDPMTAPLVVVPANVAFLANPKTPVRFTKLLIETGFVAAVAREVLGVEGFEIEPALVDGDVDMRAIAYLLTEAVTGHQPLDDAMVAVLAREAALHLVSAYSTLRRPRTDRSGRIATAKLVRVLDQIGANLDKPLPVARLARDAGLSPAHFSRAFARSTGLSPHAYIIARRLAMAAHLLRNTTVSLDQIAAQCGFHDQAHLNRSFKRAHGQTPRSYRLERRGA